MFYLLFFICVYPFYIFISISQIIAVLFLYFYYNKLKSHCTKLENIINILKSARRIVNEPLKECYAVIKEMSDTYLNTFGVKTSFSRAHIPYDNSVRKSFFGNMKREELYRTNYKSENELKESIKKYIEFYNSERPHSMLRYRTPDNAEADFFNKYTTTVASK